MIVLVAGDGQHPAANGLAMHRLGAPGTVRLLGMRLVLRSHALVWASASVADQVATDHLVVRDARAADATAVGARLDNLIAILGHSVVEISNELVVGAVDPGVRHGDSLEDAKHGGRREGARTHTHDNVGSSILVYRFDGGAIVMDKVQGASDCGWEDVWIWLVDGVRC